MATYNSEVFTLVRKSLGWLKGQIDLKVSKSNAGAEGLLASYAKPAYSESASVTASSTINQAVGIVEAKADEALSIANANKDGKIGVDATIELKGAVTGSASYSTSDRKFEIDNIQIPSIHVDLLDGVIDPSHLPKAAFSELFVAESEEAKNALTVQVEVGDTVKVGNKLYFVTSTKPDGTHEYQDYNAEADWSTITSKPDWIVNNKQITSDGYVDMTGYEDLGADVTEFKVGSGDKVTVAVAKLVKQIANLTATAEGAYVKLSSSSPQTIESALNVNGAVAFSARPTVDGVQVALKGDTDEATEVKVSSDYTAVTGGVVSAGQTVQAALHAVDEKVVSNKAAADETESDVEAIKAAFSQFVAKHEIPDSAANL